MMVRGQWANLVRMPGLHPFSVSKDILGFLMTTESQDLGLTSHPKDDAFLQYSDGVLGPTQTTGWAPPADLTNTSSSSNPVFPESPSRFWSAQPCLSSVGDRSWAAGWYGCWIAHNCDFSPLTITDLYLSIWTFILIRIEFTNLH